MANRVVVTIEGLPGLREKLRALGSGLQGALGSAGEAGTAVIRDDARGRAPGPHVELEMVQSGAESVEFAVGPDRDHWYYGVFETGAQPHPIRASAAKTLLFPGRDGAMFQPGVRHPGMGARPWLRPALDERQDDVVKVVADKLRSSAVDKVT